MADSDVDLNIIFSKIRNISVETLNDDKKHELGVIFDTLNILVGSDQINYAVVEKIALFLSENLPCVNNEHLLSKFCKFLHISNSKQNSFSKDCTNRLVQYLLSALKVSRPWVTPQILNALSTLLFENAGCLEKFWDVLVGPTGVLLAIQDIKIQQDPDILLATLKCLQNICIRKSGESYLTEDHLFSCFLVLLDVLQNQIQSESDLNDILKTKILLTCLKGLTNLVCGWKNTPKEHLGKVLGILRVLIFFGLCGKISVPYCTLYPSPISHCVVQHAPELEQDMCSNSSFDKIPIHKRRVRKRRGKATKSGKGANELQDLEDDSSNNNSRLEPVFKNPEVAASVGYTSTSPSRSGLLRQPWINSSSSDSEFSDSEFSQAAKLRSLQGKVRHFAYRALQSVNWTTEKRVMFGYWSSFLPDIPGPSTAAQGQTLLSSILKDPSPQVRGSALTFLTDLLEGSRLFLSIADESSQPRTSFIPMSVTLAEVIKELHRCLLLALVAENSPAVLIQLLKCFSALVDNVPYNRLKSGLLSTIAQHLQKIMLCRDVQVQVQVLSLLGSVVSIRLSESELSPVLFGIRGSTDENKEGESWLMTLCKDHLLDVESVEGRKVPVPIQIETMQMLAVLLHGYQPYIRKYIPMVKNIIIVSLKDQDTSVQFQGAKVLEVFGKCLFEEGLNEKVSGSIKVQEEIKQASNLWCEFLQGPLPACLQHSTDHALRAVCCDALSSITQEVFPTLPKNLQILCVTLLLGLSNDEFPNVRGSAVRCLGIFALYPCLQEASMFLLDVGEVVVRLVRDSNFNTSLKASWAMGNLSSALLLRGDRSPEEIPDVFLYTLCSSAVKASKEQCKIRANAVRTIGNLLKYMRPASLEKEQIRLVALESSRSLLSCCLEKTSMKVQWNACYAFSIALQNPHLLLSKALPLEQVLTGLMNLIRTTNNFKVQINAMIALVSIEDRDIYGMQYFDVWFCVLESLGILHKDIDFKEVTHRNNLCEQILLSIAHLVTLLHLEDLSVLTDFILASEESLMEVVHKVSQQLSSEEKIKKMEDAKSCIANLKESTPETDVMELTFLQILNNMFSEVSIVLTENRCLMTVTEM